MHFSLLFATSFVLKNSFENNSSMPLVEVTDRYMRHLTQFPNAYIRHQSERFILRIYSIFVKWFFAFGCSWPNWFRMSIAELLMGAQPGTLWFCLSDGDTHMYSLLVCPNYTNGIHLKRCNVIKSGWRYFRVSLWPILYRRPNAAYT